jgi:hypothetical protein
MTKRPRADWKMLRELLWQRCGGRCEVSGKPLDFETFDAHHRRNKGMGGTSRSDTDLLSNLLALDPVVHNGGSGSVHADRPRSEVLGWLIPKLSPYAPRMVPACVYSVGGWRWCLLGEDGDRLPLGGYIADLQTLDLVVGQPRQGLRLAERMAGKSSVHTSFTRKQLRQLTHGEWPDPERPN